MSVLEQSGPLPEGVLVLFNEPGQADWPEAEVGVRDEVEALRSALGRLNISMRGAAVRCLGDISAAVEGGNESVVFNLVERLDGSPCEFNEVPAVCEGMGRACTGGGTENLRLTFDKERAKARLREIGLRVPCSAVVAAGNLPRTNDLPPPPWIVKPLCADGSEGIDRTSITRDSGEVQALVDRVHARFSQPALVEQFIEGQEFNVSLLEENGDARAMPVSEIDFTLFPEGLPHIVGYEVKWLPGTIPGRVSPRRVPADIPEGLSDRIRKAAQRAWWATGCRDFARVDFRMDREGELYVLEVNANPDISPRAAYPAALVAAGIDFDDFVWQVLANAQGRWKDSRVCSGPHPAAQPYCP